MVVWWWYSVVMLEVQRRQWCGDVSGVVVLGGIVVMVSETISQKIIIFKPTLSVTKT